MLPLTRNNWDDFLEKHKHNLEPQKPIELSNLTDNDSLIVIFPQFRHPFASSYKDELRSGKRNSAYVMLENAELRGDLVNRNRYENTVKKKTISVASSGCQVTAAAIWGIQNDYPVMAFSPSKVPMARQEMLTTLGADVVWLPSNDEEICPRWWYVRMARRFEMYNETLNYHLDQMILAQNPIAQAKILGPQIFDSGYPLDGLFLTVGTGGCFNGLKLYKTFNNNIKTLIFPLQNPKKYYTLGPAYFEGKDCPWKPEGHTPLIMPYELGKPKTFIPIVETVDTFATGLKVFEREGPLNLGTSTWMALHPAIEYGNEHPGSVLGVLAMDSDFVYREWLLAIYGDEIPEPIPKGTPPSFKKRILDAYPELEEPLEKMIEYLKSYPPPVKRIEMIKRTYRPKREGKLYDLSINSDLDELNKQIRGLFDKNAEEFN